MLMHFDWQLQAGTGHLWYPMQHDRASEQDTAAALEGRDLTANAGMARAMSSDLECLQAEELDDWQNEDGAAAEQPGKDFACNWASFAHC